MEYNNIRRMDGGTPRDLDLLQDGTVLSLYGIKLKYTTNPLLQINKPLRLNGDGFVENGPVELSTETTVSGNVPFGGFHILNLGLLQNRILIGTSGNAAAEADVSGEVDIVYDDGTSGAIATIITPDVLRRSQDNTLVSGVRYRYPGAQTFAPVLDLDALVTQRFVLENAGGGSGKSYLVFRGGGRVDFLATTLSWTEEFHVFDPFYSTSVIPAGSLGSINEDDVLYTRLYAPHLMTSNGGVSGQVSVEDASSFNDNDSVVLGDFNSVLVSGYVDGTPSGGNMFIDDGIGNRLNLTAFNLSQGAWIQRTNLTMYKEVQNEGDLKPDVDGDIDPEIYIIGVRQGNSIVFQNGDIHKRRWVYDEVAIVSGVPYEFGDQILLPVDSRNNNADQEYRVGSGQLQFYVNGYRWTSQIVALTAAMPAISYNSGTGQVTVSDLVNLAYVSREDIFRDSIGNEFSILGSVSNLAGSKGFNIGTGQTVSSVSGSYVYRQDYDEFGADNSFSDRIVTRRFIPTNASVEFRIDPMFVENGGDGGGGGSVSGATDLQSAYDGGRFITVVTGQPIVISGPASEKLFRVLGDMEVTGVIDPKGITFSRSGASPLVGQDGLWADTDGSLNYYNISSGVNKKVDIPGVSGKKYLNDTGGSLSKGRVVRKDGTGKMNYADYDVDATSRAIGILSVDTNNGQSSFIQKDGYVEPGIITSSCFFEGSLPADGARVWLHQTGKMTVTAPSQGSGKMEVIMGVWDDGGLDLQINTLGVA